MITLYTTHCPKCRVLETKLNKAGVKYKTSEDIQKMLELGFKSAPVLDVNGEIYLFKEACLWADDQAKNIEDGCESCKLT